MSVRPERAPVTVITGAAGGIGRCLCAGLRAANHEVVAVVRGAADLDGWSVPPSLVVQADLSTPAGRHAVRDALAQGFGYLTGLVNNAGIGMGSIRPDYYKRPVQPSEIDGTTLGRFLAINAEAPVALTLALLPLFTEGWGCVLNVGTSLTAMLRPGFLPYAMSKAALESASAVLASDLQGTGIAVCVLNPGGPVATPMARRDEAAQRERLIPPEAMLAPVRWALDRANLRAVHGQRLTATHWRADRPDAGLAPIGWPQLASDSTWATASGAAR